MKKNKTVTIQEYELPVTIHEEEGFLSPVWFGRIATLREIPLKKRLISSLTSQR